MDANAPLDTTLESIFTAPAEEAITARCNDLWGRCADQDGAELVAATAQSGAKEDLWDTAPEEDDDGSISTAGPEPVAARNNPFSGQPRCAPPPTIALDVDTRGPLTRLASRTAQARLKRGWRLRRRTQRSALSVRGRRRLAASGMLALSAVALVSTLGQIGGGGRPASDQPADRRREVGADAPGTRKRLHPPAPDAKPPTRKAQPRRDRGVQRRPRRAGHRRRSTPRRQDTPAPPAPAPQRAPVPAPTPMVHSPSPGDAAGTPAPAPNAPIPEVP